MIGRTQTHLSMGLRPTGLYELVSLTDLTTSFQREDPGGEPFSQPFTLPETSLISLEALRALRALRPLMLVKVKSAKKHKEKNDVSSTSSLKPKRASSRRSTSATQLSARLTNLDPVTAELIRRLGGVT